MRRVATSSSLPLVKSWAVSGYVVSKEIIVHVLCKSREAIRANKPWVH